jgi:PiT family inorganic phosphate transporter
MGTGTSDRPNAVRWGVARSIATAWILTIPSAAVIAGVAYFALQVLSGPVGAGLRLFGI